MAAQRTAFDWVLEAAAVFVLAGMFVWVATRWAELPQSVPTHYNAAGEPNAWGSKGSIWLLPAVGAGIYALLSVIGGLPRIWNVPSQVDLNTPKVQVLIGRLLVVVKLAVLGTFAYINWTGVNVALGRSEGLGWGFLPIVLAITTLPAVYYAVKLRRLRQ